MTTMRIANDCYATPGRPSRPRRFSQGHGFRVAGVLTAMSLGGIYFLAPEPVARTLALWALVGIGMATSLIIGWHDMR